MRVALALGGTLASAAFVVACFDLFHSTSDIRTACEIDAQTPGCSDVVPDTSEDAGEDFCAWSPAVARAHASRACAWLGACETPMGRNAFGSCMLEALLAYDCEISPSHPVRGKTHDLWACLATAATCGAVDACVFPHGTQPCESDNDFTACGTAGDPLVNNDDVRVECNGGGVTHGENCALWGQTCAFNGTAGACTASRDAGGGCASSADDCIGSVLHWCVGGSDVGIDCADNGAGMCAGFPASEPTWLACLPTSDAGEMAASTAATCTSGIAETALTGRSEAVDCTELLGLPNPCVAGPLSPPFDWTSACRVDAGVDGGACVEACTATGGVSSCVRGAPVAIECNAVGLQPCRMVTTDHGAQTRAACAPPP